MIARKIEPVIRRLMEEFPAVTIFGPRQCGKTTLALTMYPGFSHANLEDLQTRKLAEEDPYEFFIRYPEPVLIDEIQRVPSLLSLVQVRIDEHKKMGQYIITGSQQIRLQNAVSQSLAGRTAIVNLLPLSLNELADAGIVLDRDQQLVSGFMPYLFQTSGRTPSDYYRSYLTTYVEKDVASVGAVHDLTRFINFLTLLAGRCGQLVNHSALSGEVGVSSTTIGSWLSILEASHLVYILKPWYTSRTSQVVKTPKVYFCDVGLAAHLLSISTPSQMNRDPLMGNLFENMIVMEAVKARYNAGKADHLFFFRNSNGLEVDLLFEHQRKIIPYEVKSGRTMDEKHTLNLKKFSANYPNDVANAGGVIYSGDSIDRFKGHMFRNFHDCSTLFLDTESTFTLSF
ncbi:MAG: AAA family ATPase [Spirochaetae bacterium HGW-Spirochaetae-8]|nr:MAG: AAA family ATPase [Spirochaetae bacterium HGW-Spirochaetae-8]